VKPTARRKRSPIARLRPYWIACLVVLGLTAVAAVAIANEPVFRLKHLAIAGLERVSRADVVERAAIDPRANVWLLNKRAIETRVEAIPYVLRAELHRRLPADVTIAIAERVPTSCVRDPAGRIVTIDDLDRVLQNDCADATLVSYTLRAPIEARPGATLRDPELSRLEADARTLEGPERHFHSYAYDRFGQLVAMLPGGVAVEFGDEDELDRKERLIGPIYAQVGLRAGQIKAVDLRAPATPVVEFKAPIHTIYTRKSTADHNI
jgi:hypothetical protein